MQVRIVSKKENPLMKRQEVRFEVDHVQGKTPERLAIKRSLAVELQVSENLVFVKNMRTMTGTGTAVGVANAYKTEEYAKFIEPDYILKRNTEKPKEEAQ